MVWLPGLHDNQQKGHSLHHPKSDTGLEKGQRHIIKCKLMLMNVIFQSTRLCYLSSLSMVFLSEGLFFFGGTGGQTFPQISWMLRLIWQLRVAALVRMRSIAVIPSPWAWRFVSISSSQDAEREFCFDDNFWWSFMRRDSMLSRISRISVTSWGAVPGGTQRVEELLGLTTWVASVLLRLIISWNFLLRSATRLKTWASRRF